MSSTRTYAVRISNVAYGCNNERRKVIITFGEEIEERLKRNHINYIYAEPSQPFSFSNNDGGYIKFYGFDCAKEVPPFMNSKFWAKYDEHTHSIRYASKAIVKMFDSFLGEYDNFWDNKLTVGDKMKYEMFHINLKERFGYTIVSSRRGSTMSIVPSERRVKLEYDEKTEERIKEVASIKEEQEELAKELAAVVKDEQKEAYEDILKRRNQVVDHDMRTMYPEVEVKSPLKEEVDRIKYKLANNLTMTADEIKKSLNKDFGKAESENAFLKHHPLDLDDVKDEFIPNDERYKVEFLADWDPDFELFPHEKTVQKNIEGIMGNLEKEMYELQERLSSLKKRYERLNYIYIAMTGHKYGSDEEYDLYATTTTFANGVYNVSTTGTSEKSLSDSLPKTEP